METAYQDTDGPQPTSKALNQNLQGGAEKRPLLLRATGDSDAIRPVASSPACLRANVPATQVSSRVDVPAPQGQGSHGSPCSHRYVTSKTVLYTRKRKKKVERLTLNPTCKASILPFTYRTSQKCLGALGHCHGAAAGPQCGSYRQVNSPGKKQVYLES